MKIDARRYKFQNAELGVMSEIMLPKKMQYQGFLFSSLLTGIEDFSFWRYYNQKGNKEKIDSLLENYPSLTNISKSRLMHLDVEFKDIFKGYSMYEVDGVFKFDKKSKYNFVEERTQIIKVYYIPNYEKIQSKINGMLSKKTAKLELQTIINFADLFFANSKVTSYDVENVMNRIKPLIDEENLKALGFTGNKDAMNEQINYLNDYFNDWVDAVAFFTFGFIMNELTNHLKRMDKEGEIPWPEEQIWVASQWGVLINKTILI